MNARRLAACLLFVVACKKSAVGADAAADASANAKGLADSANNPAVVALAKAAAACPVDKPDAHFRALLEPDCPALKTWEKNELLAKSANDTTLLNMLDDTDPTIRWLGALGLISAGQHWGADKALAVRVLSATEVEKNKFAGYQLGLATGMIDLTKTGFTDRVVALIREPSRDSWLRGGALNSLSYNDPAKFPAVREAVEAVAKKDDDAFLRGSAIRQLWMHKTSINCPLFLELIHDPDDQVDSAAVHGVADAQCPDQHEALLVEIIRRAKEGEKNETFPFALGQLGKAPGTTPAMKARLVGAAQEVLKNPKGAGLARSRAIEVMVVLDPAAKAFVSKYREDPDVLVATAAKKASG